MPQKITDEQILKTAMRQSAIDMNCCAEDFLMSKNKVVISKENADARRYLKLPFAADLVSYGNNIVASCKSKKRGSRLYLIHKVTVKIVLNNKAFIFFRMFNEFQSSFHRHNISVRCHVRRGYINNFCIFISCMNIKAVIFE